MKTVVNLSRRETIDLERQELIPSFFEDYIWISISEPDKPDSIVNSKVLDQLPKLKLAFWDVCETMEFNRDIIHPPSENDARQIVLFLLANPDKNIIVNCAAGVSRSGAVAQFCQDFLGCEWVGDGKWRASPNHKLYSMMRDYYRILVEKD